MPFLDRGSDADLPLEPLAEAKVPLPVQGPDPAASREPQAPPHPALGPPPGAKRAYWNAPEIAWPLALFAGFGGTWFGLQARVPGLAAAVAVALFVPLYAPALNRGRRGLVLVLAAGWAVGIAAAVIGAGLEVDRDAVYWTQRLPGAGAFVASDMPAPLGTGDLLRSGAIGGARVRDLVFVLLVVLLARPLLGVLGLLLVAVAQGAIASGVLHVALAAREAGEGPLQWALMGWPPHLGLTVGAALTLFVAVAEPGPLWPLRYASAARRQVLWIGLALMVLGALGGLFYAPGWAASAARWLSETR